MIKARIAFGLSFPTDSPLQSPPSPSPSPIGRPSLRFSRAEASPHRFRRIQIAFRAEKSFSSSPHKDDFSHAQVVVPPGDKSVSAATLVGVATLVSKILGLLREVIMASVFGVGPVATAFKYAWVLPGFSSSLLGGVNGPIHIIMSTTLSKLPEERGKKLFQHLTTIMFLVGGAVGAFVYIFPDFVVQIYAPGLWVLAEGQIIREIAIKQLKMMTPCIVLAGPVGLGFGYMSAQGNDVLPCISPALSSSLVIASCLVCALTSRLNGYSAGASLLSYAVSIGLFLQWIIQVIVLRRRWSDITPYALITIFKSVDVYQFFSLLLPATVSSGLAQIASFTDLFFASLIPGAAAGLSYAYLLVIAPLGALSSIIVLPLVPKFSKLVKTSSWESLANDLERALLLCMVLLLPIFSVMRSLVEPIIHILFERCAFDSSASALVSTLFLAYSLGTPLFIAKDLLVAVFYALGDGKRPFLVSAGAVALNAVLDWLSVSRFNLGAKGLALSTSFTAALSVLILFHLLKGKLSGLSSYAAMIYPTTLLLICCITSNITTSVAYSLMHVSVASTLLSRYNLMMELFTLSMAGAFGLIGFFVPAVLLHLCGFELARDLYRMVIMPQSLTPMTKSF
ncbi:probable lipid II flippase MurJ isoform X1 [Salvia splendens]|uniref:probable lipid II flippase MurJ isoform X1 n=1 Tax=Salvia splendens TaxID=180675 RepID=UPI001C26F2B8|nr:probable lipid II flippase MurJ isoform X1 [Salvia splendens]